ncbi:MAG TPA: hypothetical protein VEC35_08810 [Noviherbaspirillum sp.]|nr:hypothetical protein [Noviherbaspirillum sp.]
MTDSGTIFQRTQAGRDEIHQKSHGLTQSERLVLIMVDGVSTYSQIRAKLPVLKEERFDRAFQKLQLKELVLEVFMPVDDQAPDEIERTVIDRFLEQDPMDPVTIMMTDHEEEMEFLVPSHPTQPAGRAAEPLPLLTDVQISTADPAMATVPASAPTAAATAVVEPTKSNEMPEPAVDALHAQLVDSLAEEVRAKRALKPIPPARMEQMQPAAAVAAAPQSEPSPFTAVHWGYWLIVSGLSFILGFVLARITI